MLTVATEKFAPVHLVALLRNVAVTLGRDRHEVQRLTTRLDLRLRSERTLPGLAGVLELVKDDEVRGLVTSLGQALQPICDLIEAKEIDAGRLAGALDRAVMALIDGAELPGLVEFREWARVLVRPAAGPVRLDPHPRSLPLEEGEGGDGAETAPHPALRATLSPEGRGDAGTEISVGSPRPFGERVAERSEAG